MLANRFGQFDPTGWAYTITDPATPMPWVNVVCNGRYGFVISQNGGGFSWLDDAQHNVLTRWEMDLVRDCYGKFLYLADRESGEVWSVAPTPCLTRHEEYACTHQPGSTTFVTRAHDIRSRWTMLVSPHENVELWLVELTNCSKHPRSLRVSSYLEWTCGVAPDSKREFHRLFFTTRFDASRRAVLATKNMWDIPGKSERDHWNREWPYVAAHALCGAGFSRPTAIGDKASFLGRYTSTARPQAMTRDVDGSGTFGRFGDACAALGGDLALAPGQTARFHFLLAIADDEKGVLSLVDRYASAEAAEKAGVEASRAWKERLGTTQVRTGREDFDLLQNCWLPYQAISGRMWARTGYYQQSGARGFRDQLQDSQVWLPIEPSRCRDQLMLHATRQFTDGTVNHWWHALADFGNHTACSDDYLWLPFVSASYLRETGDLGVLTLKAPWRDDPSQGTLLEHCRRSFARAFERLSPRGLPHIGSCDWNDGLSAMGIGGKGESVWLGEFLCALLRDWTHILEQLGDHALAGEYRGRRAAMITAINEHAWDGRWYRYGTKDSGEWVGSGACAEGRIHLNAQTWAILSDVAPADRGAIAWQSVRENLLTPFGPLLLAPAYSVPDPDIGYITRYSPGSRENGGVYMHAATWALATACKLRDQGSVEQIWDSISPPWRGRSADSYWAEPYVTPGNVDGPTSDLPGRAGWTWYTGSAAWLNRVSLEWVLGIRPVWDGLCIDPVPARSLGRVRARRVWRGVPVEVSFDASRYSGARRPVLTVGGRSLETNVIPASLLTGVPSGGLAVEVDWPAQRPAQAGTPAGLGSVSS